MTNTIKIVVSLVVVAALVATRLSSSSGEPVSKSTRGLKGRRVQQQQQLVGGISTASANTIGSTISIGTLNGVVVNPAAPQLGATGTSIAQGTSFGSSFTVSPGQGNSQASAFGNGAGNSTTTVNGGDTAAGVGQSVNAQTVGDFASGGVGYGTFGTPLAIPGTGNVGVPAVQGDKKNGGYMAAIPATPPVIIPARPTGGLGGGFGFTLGATIGNATGNSATSQGAGFATSNGGGSGQGTSIFGTAGGNGGGNTAGSGVGITIPLVTPSAAAISFNATGGGLASGFAGGYVGFTAQTPDFSIVPLGP